MQEGEPLSVQALPVFGEPAACEGALYNPSLRQDYEAPRRIRTLDDLHVHPRHDFLYGGAKQRPLIAAVGVELQQKRKHTEHRRHHQRATVAVLNVSRVHY